MTENAKRPRQTRMLSFAITQAEFAAIQTAATHDRLSVSAYIRRTIMQSIERATNVPADQAKDG